MSNSVSKECVCDNTNKKLGVVKCKITNNKTTIIFDFK